MNVEQKWNTASTEKSFKKYFQSKSGHNPDVSKLLEKWEL